MAFFKILIVDDDSDDRDIMQAVLDGKASTQHLILSSAEETLTYLEAIERDEDLPQLIMTDLNMPGMNGIELLKKLKSTERYASIDVLVYSTSTLRTQIELCLALGAKDYMTKPSVLVGYQQLADRISDAAGLVSSEC